MGQFRRAATENCSSSEPVHMWFCASYSGPRYFGDASWLRTFIHEHTHGGCRSPGGVLTTSEIYQRDSRFPPSADIALKDPDSYAVFAVGVP